MREAPSYSLGLRVTNPIFSAQLVQGKSAGVIIGSNGLSLFVGQFSHAVTATATVLIAGAAAITQAGDTASGAAGVLISGALSATEADDTLASAHAGNAYETRHIVP